MLGISEGVKTMNFEMGHMVGRYNWNAAKRDSFKAKCLKFFGSQIKKTGLVYGMYEGIIFTSNLSYAIEQGIRRWLSDFHEVGYFYLVVEGEFMGFYGVGDNDVFTESWWGYPNDLKESE